MTAINVPGVRDPASAKQRKVFGLCVHTTGSGVTAKAKKKGTSPLLVAIETYIDSQNGSNGYFWGGPTFVGNYDGAVYRLAPDHVLTNHCGGPNRALYLTGTWRSQCSASMVKFWDQRWHGRYKSPYHLFPSTTPNADYVGLELIPCADGFGGEPLNGTRFTQAQHEAVATIATYLATTHRWPGDWVYSPRLLGHEDLDPIARSDVRGGWDPGALRAKPYFDFDYVRNLLQEST